MIEAFGGDANRKPREFGESPDRIIPSEAAYAERVTTRDILVESSDSKRAAS